MVAWAKSQQREEAYDSARWGIPYSEEYWLDFIKLDAVKAPTLEVGCGEHGLWRFNKDVTGLDPIDYSSLGSNFTQGKAERLPFRDNYFEDVICVNALDHCEYPKQALAEMFRVTKGRVILWNYVFPWPVKPLYFGHPHAFTLKELQRLPPFYVDKPIYYYAWSPQRLFSDYVKGRFERAKLWVASKLGVTAFLVVWRKH